MNGEIRDRLDCWLQRRPVIMARAGVPYLLLALLAATAFAVRREHGAALALDGTLCAITAAWMLGMYTVNPGWRRRTRLMTVYVAGLMALTAVLAYRSGWFGFFIVVILAYARELLPWPRPMYVAVGLAAIGAISQEGGAQAPLLLHAIILLVALAMDVVLIPTFVWLLHERERQVEQHRQSLAELGEANRQLEATIAENEGLHRQLVTQAREAGVLDERRRMAREIHDTLAQGLTGIITQLQAAEQAATRTPGEQPGWQRHVAAATQLARDSLTEARRSVDALRPQPLDGCRLSEALNDVAERWSDLNGIPVQVTTTGTARPFDPEAEFALLRAAQEALANVARHARATRVGVTISYMENEVALDVRDDGVGFDPALLEHGTGLDHGMELDRGTGLRHGFGLVAMRQRIAALSGTVQVESEPGGGTAISACVPTVPGLVRS